MTAARARLRGYYALAAGALLLLIVPFYVGQVLAPAGYNTATAALAQHGNFDPMVAWLGANLEIDRGLRLLQLLPYLLILPLSGALAWAFWQRETRDRTAVLWCGRIGALCVLVGGIVGMFTSGAAADAYLGATSAAARASVVTNFEATYAVETLLAQALGGLLLAIMVGLVSARAIRQRALPPVISYFGLLVAALGAGNAVLFALDPTAAQTLVSPIAYAAFALWLIAIGIPLARLIIEPLGAGAGESGAVVVPHETAQPSQETPGA